MSEGRKSPQRLAVFGAYSDHDLYQRNRILVAMLEELSQATIVVRPQGRSDKHGFSANVNVFARVAGMLRDAFSLWSQRSLLRECDTIFVPYPAYLDLLVLWACGCVGRQRIVADAFLELHSTVASDRKLVPSNSLRARFLEAFQRFTLCKADIVLIDTPEQAILLRQQLRSSRVQIADVPVGIDESIWTEMPLPPLSERLQLLFWGTFIPLHGVEHIVAALRILERRDVPVDLKLIGDGQTAPDVAKSLTDECPVSLSWDRRLVDSEALRAEVAQSHIVLGVFGDSLKAASVVPYKVHQALASGRPVITRDGPTMEGIADEGRGLILCPPSNPEALALKIEETVARLNSGWRPASRAVYDESLGREVLRGKLESALGLSAGRSGLGATR